MLLVGLPDEILIGIITQPLLAVPDLSSICRASRRLASLAREQLYRLNAQHHRSSALSWAAEEGRLNTARLALQYGAGVDIKSRERNGSTPLNLAAENNHSNMVKLLLSEGADINSYNVYHETALSIAAQEGNSETVDVLLHHGEIQPDLADTSGQTPLFWACCNNHPDVVKRLLGREDIDINRQKQYGVTPLITAINSCYMEVFEVLLSWPGRIDPNISTADGRTALMFAATRGNDLILERLLGIPGINLSAQDNQGLTSLLHAVKAGTESIVKKLVAIGANVNHQGLNGLTPLAVASDQGHEKIIRVLLEHGADPSVLDIRGWSPLHWAAQSGHLAATRELLEDSRVNPSLASFVGTTPLHCASWDGHCDVIQLLLGRQDIDVNCADNAGWTSLIWAAFNGTKHHLRLLLADPRVDVNAQDHNGMTALCFAAKKGNSEAMKILLRHSGINLEVKDRKGKTAQMYAFENGFENLATLP